MKKQVLLNLCAVLIAGLLVFTGCPTDSDSSGESYDRNVDIVVVGAGLAGASAALSAVDAYPNVKVVLIDKGAVVGGSLWRAAGGISGPAYNAKTDPVGAMTAWKNSSEVPGSTNVTLTFVTGYPNYGKVLQVAVNTKELLDEAYPRWGISLSTSKGGYTDGTNNTTSGAAGAAKFDAAVKAASHIEWIPQCTAKELIVINGIVSGVRAEKDGKKFTIKAKNTILATGGFSRSAEMLANYVDPDLVPNVKAMADYNRSVADSGAVGDGIGMAKAVGAKIYDKAVIHLQGLKYAVDLTRVGPELNLAFSHELYGTGPQLQVRNQILVNKDGVRFTSEQGTVAYNSSPLNGRALYNEAKPPYWIIFDSNNPDNKESGSASTTAAVNLTNALDAAAALNIGEVYKAGSIENLAAAIGVPSAALVSTVSTYNGYVDSIAASGTNVDPLGKPDSLITKKIAAGPNFYAVKLYPESHISIGGPVSDYLGRVLNEDGAIIPHLYAVGELSNREFYNVNYVGAASLALYPTIGRMAGLDAAKDAKSAKK
jgi:fumarate reductase flavoprotein subunit